MLRRSIKRPRVTTADRLFWVFLYCHVESWRKLLQALHPETVIRWHREGFRRYWRRKSNGIKPGRPPVDVELRNLIREMQGTNVGWGAPRIHGELLKLGIDVSQATVSKYMLQSKNPPKQTWQTFLNNHEDCIASIDFSTVPTATFRILYVFVVLSHKRRVIAHFNITQHPTAQWTAQQLTEAFPFESAPQYLVRDRDAIYGEVVRKRIKSLGIKEIVIAPRSPWQNPFAERVIGSIRRDCLDRIIVINEKHLRRVLADYLDYYHGSRTHLSLNKDPPVPREVEHGTGQVVGLPKVGGLHHRYIRAAA